ADRANLNVLDPNTIKEMDSLNAGEYALYGVYERGVRAFNAGEYEVAGLSFSRVASAKSPYSKKARSYAIWINYYREEKGRAEEATRIHLLPFPDSLGLIASRSYYNVARFFSNYSLSDSTEHYYRQSLEW